MIVKKEMDYAKEISEVFAFINAFVADLKAGKTLIEAGSAQLPAFMVAIQGIEQAPEEVKANLKACMVTGVDKVYDLIDILLAKKA